MSTIIKKTRKCKLHETLRKVVARRTDPLGVELAAKLSYASSIRAEEAKYHKGCIQRFLRGVMVVPGPINYKHPVDSKDDGFNIFCNLYESISHDST